MPKHRLFRFVSELVRIYGSKQVARSAAGLSYFLTLSIFPFLICINAAADLIPLDDGDFLAAIRQFVPENVVSVLGDYLTYVSSNRSEALLAAGLLVMLTSSSAAFRSLLGSIDDIYDRRSYIGLWGLIVSVFCSLVLLFTVFSAALVLVSGRWIYRFIETELPLLPILTQWSWVRFFILFLILFGAVYLLFRFTAPRTKPRLPVSGSACLTSVALVLVSVVFSWLISMSSRYSLVYGSLAAIIILMAWLYLCGVILLLGAAVNARVLDTFRSRYRPLKKTESQTVSLLRDPMKGYRHIRTGKKRNERHGGS